MNTFPVDIHAHTIASTHAYSTIHDYIAAAKQANVQLFALTDHGPDMADAPHFWHFVNMTVIPRVIEGIGILRGIEANIKNREGEIDFYGDFLQQLDIVLAGLHEPVLAPSDTDLHTEAMYNCIKSGKVDVITHPGNPRYPIEQELIVKTAAQHNVALEINNSSFIHSRKGSESNCLALAKLAKKYDAQLVMGSDSHIALTLGGFERSLEIVDTADYPRERLLNNSPSQLLSFLKLRGHHTLDELELFFSKK